MSSTGCCGRSWPASAMPTRTSCAGTASTRAPRRRAAAAQGDRGVAGRRRRRAGAAGLVGSRLCRSKGCSRGARGPAAASPGIDNQYHALYVLATRSLIYGQYLRDLVPEWAGAGRVRVELQRADGGREILEMTHRAGTGLGGAAVARGAARPRQVGLPDGVPAAAGRRPGDRLRPLQAHGRLPRDPRTARPDALEDHQAGFGHRRVPRVGHGDETPWHADAGPGLSRHPGGNSLMSEILVYYIYGREKLHEMAGVGTGEHGAFRYSRLYFADRRASPWRPSTRARGAARGSDYDFAWSYVDGKPIARRSGPEGEPPMVKFLRLSPTFREEYDAATYSGYYQPRTSSCSATPAPSARASASSSSSGARGDDRRHAAGAGAEFVRVRHVLDSAPHGPPGYGADDQRRAFPDDRRRRTCCRSITC